MPPRPAPPSRRPGDPRKENVEFFMSPGCLFPLLLSVAVAILLTNSPELENLGKWWQWLSGPAEVSRLWVVVPILLALVLLLRPLSSYAGYNFLFTPRYRADVFFNLLWRWRWTMDGEVIRLRACCQWCGYNMKWSPEGGTSPVTHYKCSGGCGYTVSLPGSRADIEGMVTAGIWERIDQGRFTKEDPPMERRPPKEVLPQQATAGEKPPQ